MCVILRDHADDGDHNDEWAWYLLWRRLCSWIFSFSAGSDSGEQQLIVNSFLWNPFLSGIFTWKITPLQSHQHCQKEQDHLSYYNIFVRCRELHNDDSVWVSRVEDHMSCRRCLRPLPGLASPTASCLSTPRSPASSVKSLHNRVIIDQNIAAGLALRLQPFLQARQCQLSWLYSAFGE